MQLTDKADPLALDLDRSAAAGVKRGVRPSTPDCALFW